MRYLFLPTMAAFLSIFLITGFSNQAQAYCPHPNLADSATSQYQSHCGIWLCLPAGFGAGCAAQHSAFKSRLAKRRCDALPSYSNCTGGGNGSYQLGSAFQPCQDGFNLQVFHHDEDEGPNREIGRCMNADNSCIEYRREDGERVADRRRCGDYTTPKRRYIDLTIEGQAMPRYWW